MNALDLFCGTGWDIAARGLGIDPLGIDFEPDVIATREAAGMRSELADIAALDPMDYAPCDLLIASPPCQAWSMAGKRQGQEDIGRVYELTAAIANASRQRGPTPDPSPTAPRAAGNQGASKAASPAGVTPPQAGQSRQSQQASRVGDGLREVEPVAAQIGLEGAEDGASVVNADSPGLNIGPGLTDGPSSLSVSVGDIGVGGNAVHEVPSVGVDDVKIHAGVDVVKGWADPRSALVTEPLRWALALRPRLIAWEQVPPALGYWKHCAEILRGEGYSAWAGCLRAEQYGVPQTRTRAFLLASLNGPVEPPKPTHQRYVKGEPQRHETTLEGEVLPWVSMAEALAGVSDRWPVVPAPTVTAGGGDTGGPEVFGRGGRVRLHTAAREERG